MRVLASRILGLGALVGGMPRYKYVSNRVLTLLQNILMRQKLSEYHTGYRAWSREVLERLPLEACSDDFVFDNQMLAQAAWFGMHIGEISCPTRYFAEASSINFRRSVTYGLGVVGTALLYRLAAWGTRTAGDLRRRAKGAAGAGGTRRGTGPRQEVVALVAVTGGGTSRFEPPPCPPGPACYPRTMPRRPSRTRHPHAGRPPARHRGLDGAAGLGALHARGARHLGHCCSRGRRSCCPAAPPGRVAAPGSMC